MAEPNKGKTVQLIAKLNVGRNDQQRLSIPNSPDGEFPPREGDIITVTEDQAVRILAGTSALKEYDAKAEEKLAEEARQAEEDRLRPAVEARLARERVEADVKAKAGKATAKLPPATTRFDMNPHAEEADKNKVK